MCTELIHSWISNISKKRIHKEETDRRHRPGFEKPGWINNLTNGVYPSWEHIFGKCHRKDDWWEQENWWLTLSKTSLNVHISREHFQDIWKSDCLSGLTLVTVHGSGCGFCVPLVSSSFHNSKICCVWLWPWPFSAANIIQGQTLQKNVETATAIRKVWV